MKQQNIQRTFFRVSQGVIVIVTFFLVRLNYLMIEPHLVSILWALLWAVFLHRPQIWICNALKKFDKLAEKSSSLQYFLYIAPISPFLMFIVSETSAVSTIVCILVSLFVFFVAFGERVCVSSCLVILVSSVLVVLPSLSAIFACAQESTVLIARCMDFVEHNRQFMSLVTNIGESAAYQYLRTMAGKWGWEVGELNNEIFIASLSDGVGVLGDYVSVFWSGAFALMANLSDFCVSFATFVSCLYFFLVSRATIISGFSQLSPFSPSDNDRLVASLKRSVWRMLMCSVFVGCLHIVAAFVSFRLVGGLDLYVTLCVLSGVTAMLPVFSTWVVWLPVCLGSFFLLLLIF